MLLSADEIRFLVFQRAFPQLTDVTDDNPFLGAYVIFSPEIPYGQKFNRKRAELPPVPPRRTSVGAEASEWLRRVNLHDLLKYVSYGRSKLWFEPYRQDAFPGMPLPPLPPTAAAAALTTMFSAFFLSSPAADLLIHPEFLRFKYAAIGFVGDEEKFEKEKQRLSHERSARLIKLLRRRPTLGASMEDLMMQPSQPGNFFQLLGRDDKKRLSPYRWQTNTHLQILDINPVPDGYNVVRSKSIAETVAVAASRTGGDIRPIAITSAVMLIARRPIHATSAELKSTADLLTKEMADIVARYHRNQPPRTDAVTNENYVPDLSQWDPDRAESAASQQAHFFRTRESWIRLSHDLYQLHSDPKTLAFELLEKSVWTIVTGSSYRSRPSENPLERTHPFEEVSWKIINYDQTLLKKVDVAEVLSKIAPRNIAPADGSALGTMNIELELVAASEVVQKLGWTVQYNRPSTVDEPPGIRTVPSLIDYKLFKTDYDKRSLERHTAIAFRPLWLTRDGSTWCSLMIWLFNSQRDQDGSEALIDRTFELVVELLERDGTLSGTEMNQAILRNPQAALWQQCFIAAVFSAHPRTDTGFRRLPALDASLFKTVYRSTLGKGALFVEPKLEHKEDRVSNEVSFRFGFTFNRQQIIYTLRANSRTPMLTVDDEAYCATLKPLELFQVFLRGVLPRSTRYSVMPLLADFLWKGGAGGASPSLSVAGADKDGRHLHYKYPGETAIKLVHGVDGKISLADLYQRNVARKNLTGSLFLASDVALSFPLQLTFRIQRQSVDRGDEWVTIPLQFGSELLAPAWSDDEELLRLFRHNNFLYRLSAVVYEDGQQVLIRNFEEWRFRDYRSTPTIDAEQRLFDVDVPRIASATDSWISSVPDPRQWGALLIYEMTSLRETVKIASPLPMF